MDIGIAAEHFCLQAAEEGLGTCMLAGSMNQKSGKCFQFQNVKESSLSFRLVFLRMKRFRLKAEKTWMKF